MTRVPRRLLTALAVVLAVALVAVLVTVVFRGPAQKTVTAYFPEAVHVYAGSDVDVLGVPVGTVKSVQPEGTQVKVVLSYDASRKIPSNVSAVVLDPTLVADRVVQLAPVYSGGRVLANNAVIPLSRNEVPVELDELNRNLYQLTQALGPEGANRNGALSRAIAVGDANLSGQGGKANSTLRHLSALMQTLNDNRGTLVSTVNNLQSFTSTLAANDSQVRGFASELTKVSAELDAERQDFAAALHNLGIALGEVAAFIHHNRAELSTDVRGLSTVSTILARERTLLAHIADIGAVGISNYPHMYTPSQRTYNARFNFNTLGDNPAVFVCQALGSVGGDPKKCLQLLSVLKGLSLPSSSKAASNRKARR
jgi:phospholipid/cholesterol/gamma-HCH transport system substrate-binding protein